MKLNRFAILLALLAAPALAEPQQPDYLSKEEVEQAREIQEPNKRIELFLKFADTRLAAFEKALQPTPGEEPPRPYQLKDLLNDFIRAVDDTTDKTQQPLERGGVELKKGRDKINVKGREFLARLQAIQNTEAGASEDLRFDLEDAVDAVNELLALAKNIPDGLIPVKTLPAMELGTEKEEAAPAGKPTLKRRTDKPEDKPKPKP
ncbi:MAG TPA: hypothetical protein VNN18_08130 [Candidatus Xenobia bacterium]|nr:hypothetical protein [Candidatus Xenobia bacterium]